MTLETVKAALTYYKGFNTAERKDFHSAQQQTARSRYLREHVETFENNKVLLDEFEKGIAEHDTLADTWDKRARDAEERDLHRTTKTVKQT